MLSIKNETRAPALCLHEGLLAVSISLHGGYVANRDLWKEPPEAKEKKGN
jgi:hypothetical protein